MTVSSNNVNYPVNLHNPTAVGDSQYSEDGDKVLQNDLNSLFFLLQKEGITLGASLTQAQLATVATQVDQLMAYFQSHGTPTPTNNPVAYAIYNLLNSPIPNSGSSETFANLCSDLMTGTSAQQSAALAVFTGPNSVGAVDAFLMGPGSATSPTLVYVLNEWWYHRPSGDTGVPGSTFNQEQLLAPLEQVQTDLQKLEQDMASGLGQGNFQFDTDLQKLATDMVHFSLLIPPGGVTDGYLQIYNSFVNAPTGVQLPGSVTNPPLGVSLLTLAQNFSNDPSNVSYENAFINALNAQGETGNSNGQFMGMLNVAIWGEG